MGQRMKADGSCTNIRYIVYLGYGMYRNTCNALQIYIASCACLVHGVPMFL